MATTRRAAPSGPAPDESGLLTLDDRREMLRYLMLMRAVEERGLTLYKQGKIPGSFYDGRGQEAISVGATFALAGADAVCSPLIRDLGSHLVRGTDLTEIFKHYMGRDNTISRGREGNIHFGDRRRGIVGLVSMLPEMMLVACGLAMAYRMQDQPRVALSFFGDGATSPGSWHEAMNWAGLERLPVIFVLEHNQTAYSTPSTKQYPVDPIERAAGYGIASDEVDGNDVEQMFRAVHDARERALRGDGPTMIAARTMRMHGHGAHDDARYVDPELLAYWRERDPIAGYVAYCASIGIDTEAVSDEVVSAVSSAVEAALEAQTPNPASATEGVFCEDEPEPLGVGTSVWSGYATEAAAV